MTPGRIAYEAFAENFPGPAGKLAVPWERLPPDVQAAWEASAKAVKDAS